MSRLDGVVAFRGGALSSKRVRDFRQALAGLAALCSGLELGGDD